MSPWFVQPYWAGWTRRLVAEVMFPVSVLLKGPRTYPSFGQSPPLPPPQIVPHMQMFLSPRLLFLKITQQVNIIAPKQQYGFETQALKRQVNNLFKNLWNIPISFRIAEEKNQTVLKAKQVKILGLLQRRQTCYKTCHQTCNQTSWTEKV